MEQIGMYEARTKFAELVRAIKDGGKEFLITNRGEPVAVMTQAEPKFSSASSKGVLDRIRMRRKELSKVGFFLKTGESVNDFSRSDLKW